MCPAVTLTHQMHSLLPSLSGGKEVEPWWKLNFGVAFVRCFIRRCNRECGCAISPLGGNPKEFASPPDGPRLKLDLTPVCEDNDRFYLTLSDSTWFFTPLHACNSNPSCEALKTQLLKNQSTGELHHIKLHPLYFSSKIQRNAWQTRKLEPEYIHCMQNHRVKQSVPS